MCVWMWLEFDFALFLGLIIAMRFGSRGPNDTSPTCIDREDLGRRRTGTEQSLTHFSFEMSNKTIDNVLKTRLYTL